jgi:hypothetical protein
LQPRPDASLFLRKTASGVAISKRKAHYEPTFEKD